jgi:hypothetical protein
MTDCMAEEGQADEQNRLRSNRMDSIRGFRLPWRRKPDGLSRNRWACQSRAATDSGAIAFALAGCRKSLCMREIPSPAE